MKQVLTDSALRGLKPREAPFKLTDGGGLYVLVMPNGAKYWRYNYVLDGKAKTLALGQYPATKLKEAREAHQAAKEKVQAGIDPVQARQAEEAERQNRKTFKDAADGWNQLINRKPRADKTRDRDERMIGYLINAIGNKPIDEVRAKDLIDLLETFEDNESYETRARLQAAALNIGGYAQGKAWIKHNPFLGIAYGKAFTSPTNRPRPAIIEGEPFGPLLRDVAAYSGRQGNLVRKALDLLALTFVRPGTVTQAEWDEFDLDGALWTIPFKKLKQRKFRESIKELTGKPHCVPLSRQAVALLHELKKQTGNGRYLFSGRKGRPISTNALEVALKSLGYQDTHCPHGFRSSASTLLNAERITVEGTDLPRFAEQAIEFQLEHVDASVAAIYNRDQRLPERAKMMQFWADKIDALRDGGSVAKLAHSGGPHENGRKSQRAAVGRRR
jgi:integrase